MTAPQTPPKSSRSHSLLHPTRPLRLWQETNHAQDETRIELVPLMDIIFCILTFFILAAVGLSRQQAISMDLPKASTGQPQMREMLVVSLDDMGQLYVEKQPVTENQLLDALKNYRQYNPTGLMVLHASRNASYNDVVQLLDMLRQVGGDRVALATLPGESTTSSTLPSFGNPNANFPSSIGGAGTNPTNPYGTTTPGMPNNSLPTMPNSAGTGTTPFPGSVPGGTTMPNTGLGNSGLTNGMNSTIPNAPNPGMPGTGTVPNPAVPNPAVPDRLPRR